MPAGFGGMDPPARWPRPHGGPSPDALALGIDTLPGVGPAVRRRLERLGLRTVGDLLAHRPRRYERPVDEKAIAELFGDEEAVIEGTVGRTRSRRRGRLHILTARIGDGTGEIDATWFNQPWLEKQLAAGARVRLRGKRNRYGFQVDSLRPRRRDRDRRLCARLPVQRAARAKTSPRHRRRCAAVRARGRATRCRRRCARRSRCLCAPTRSWRSIARARSRRQR